MTVRTHGVTNAIHLPFLLNLVYIYIYIYIYMVCYAKILADRHQFYLHTALTSRKEH
jgi:hypothetical protein